MNRVHLTWLFSLALLTGCQPEQASAPAMGQVLGESQAQFAPVLPSTTLQFPADHQAHPNFRQEWWYLTANLITDDGMDLGLQWTQFRVGFAKQAHSNNPWQTPQLYMAHAALTTATEHVNAERWSRAHPELAGVEADPLRVYLDDWQWQSDNRDLFPAVLSGKAMHQGQAFSYQFSLTSQAPYQLQGERGYSEKNAAGTVASHYYSQPFIEMSGTVTIGEQSYQVSGDGWLDREWSSQFLDKSQQGWDWFALRLDQDTALMVFQLRATAASDAESKTDHFYAGNLMKRDGSNIRLSPEQIHMTALHYHQLDQHQYPVQWQLQIKDFGIDVQLAALNPNAQMPLTVKYWEGPIQISGSHQGRGYMELTGY